MRLRSFAAPTMRDAMAMVREALGADAIIVSTHESERGRGVHVMAAIEPTEPLPLARSDESAKEGAQKDRLERILSYHGVPPRLAHRLIGATTQSGGESEVVSLASGLDNRFFFDKLTLSAERPTMFVGASGAGKTTTVAKLAARLAISRENSELVTTDSVRAGAFAQLDAFADILRQPLFAAATPAELKRFLEQRRNDVPVLIDTPGTNPYSRSELDDLRRFTDAGDFELVLVQPAGMDGEEAAEASAAFRTLGCRKMLVTRLDAARRLGGILAAADAGRLGLTEVGITPSVTQGLKPLNPMSLARVLCRDPIDLWDDKVLGERS